MKIALKKSQYELLTKRNVAKTEAENSLRTAQVIHNSLVAAMNDCIVQIVDENETQLTGELQSVAIKSNKDGTYELELLIKEPHDTSNAA